MIDTCDPNIPHTYPSISILISSYNKASYISDCLSTLEELVGISHEIIVVDDGSTDNSLEIIDSFKNPNLRLFIQKNGGSASSRNRAVLEARNDVLIFLDMDDQINQDKLRHALSVLKNTFTIAMLNFETFPIRSRGSVISKTENAVTLDLKSHRDSFYNAMGFWRNLYSRKFVIENELKFLPTFSQVGGKYFILDDLFWLLHMSALETNIYCFPENDVLYRYRNASVHDRGSWRRYKDQLVLMSKAFEIFFTEIDKCNHKHDDAWLAHKSKQILEEHLRMLDLKNLHKVFFDLIKLFIQYRKRLEASFLSAYFYRFLINIFLHATKNSVRDIFFRSMIGSWSWEKIKRIVRQD